MFNSVEFVICSAVNAWCQSNMISSNWSLCSCRWKIFNVLFPYPTFHILLWNVDSNLEKCVLQGLCGMCEGWSLRCICLFFFFPLKAVASTFKSFFVKQVQLGKYDTLLGAYHHSQDWKLLVNKNFLSTYFMNVYLLGYWQHCFCAVYSHSFIEALSSRSYGK